MSAASELEKARRAYAAGRTQRENRGEGVRVARADATESAQTGGAR